VETEEAAVAVTVKMTVMTVKAAAMVEADVTDG
jgi:hypothetical protein